MKDAKKSILPDDINWEHLKRFKICAESKSFKEAAEKIDTSTNALSQQINSLEKELGFTLFELVNHNRTLKLTHHGDRVLQLVSMAQLYLNGSRPLNKEQILQEEAQHKIKIVTTPGLADTFLGKIFHAFLTKYPDYQIEVLAVGPAIKIQDDEIMIRADIKNQKDIIKETLFDLPMNLYASEDYIKKMGKPINLEDLQYHKILVFQGLNYGSSNWGLLRTRGFFIDTPIISNSIDFLYYMCCQGHGILELPEIYPQKQNLVRIFENIDSPKFTISLAFRKEILLKIGISEFVNFIVNSCQKNN